MNKQILLKLKLKTISGSLDCWIENKTCFVNMGKPCFDWSDTTFKKLNQIINIDQFELFCVSMGNPHGIIFFQDEDDLNKVDIESIGKKIQSNDIFPESINVEFATILKDKTIRMKVWERGAGRTLACGTGACATLVAAQQKNLSQRKNDIILDGGKLTINWLDSNDVIMSDMCNLLS